MSAPNYYALRWKLHLGQLVNETRAECRKAGRPRPEFMHWLAVLAWRCGVSVKTLRNWASWPPSLIQWTHTSDTFTLIVKAPAGVARCWHGARSGVRGSPMRDTRVAERPGTGDRCDILSIDNYNSLIGLDF